MSDNTKKTLKKITSKTAPAFDDFKKFAFKGNVIDMAVGVIIGAAFGKIVTSVVNDLVMPLFGLLTGGVSFSELSLVLKEATETTEALTLKYGAFLQAIFDFLLIAISVYIFVKLISKAKSKFEKKQAEEPPAEEAAAEPAEEAVPAPTSEDLLGEIRDLLKDMNKKEE